MQLIGHPKNLGIGWLVHSYEICKEIICMLFQQDEKKVPGYNKPWKSKNPPAVLVPQLLDGEPASSPHDQWDLQSLLTVDDLQQQNMEGTWPAEGAAYNGVLDRGPSKTITTGVELVSCGQVTGEILPMLGLGLPSVSFGWSMGSLGWLWPSSAGLERKRVPYLKIWLKVVKIHIPAPRQSAGVKQKDTIVTNLCRYMDWSHIYALLESELSDRVLMVISNETKYFWDEMG